MPLFSIIIPVYNAASFLNRCLNSILNQTFLDFEVIVVNDGSIDNSLDISQQFAKIDNRVNVYSQKNKGVSAARNLGLQHSLGQYIVFVDSDDFVTSDYLNVFYEVLKEGKDVFILQNVKCVYNTKENPNRWAKGDNLNNLPDDFLYDYKDGFYLNTDDFFNSVNIFDTPHPFAKLFRRDIITNNKITFDTELEMGEDLVFFIQYLRNWSSAVCCLSKKIGYNYNCENTGSAMSIRNTDSNRLKLINTLLDISKKVPCNPIGELCRYESKKKFRELYSTISSGNSEQKYAFIEKNILPNKDLKLFFYDTVGELKGRFINFLLQNKLIKIYN